MLGAIAPPFKITIGTSATISSKLIEASCNPILSMRNLSLFSLLIFLLAGCNPPASQCKQFAAVTQQSTNIREAFDQDIETAQVKLSGAQSLSDLQGGAKDYAAAVNKVIAQLNTMTQAFEQISITDEQLSEYRSQYLSFVEGSKSALTDANGAMQMVIESKNERDFRAIFGTFTAQSDRAYNKLKALDTQENEILTQLNSYCTESVGLPK